jgi:hypothetical protein
MIRQAVRWASSVAILTALCIGLSDPPGETALAYPEPHLRRNLAPAPVVTFKGAGALHLGATVAALHRRHLIGRLRPGCELDPGQRIARLRPPLRGSAIFTHPNTRLASLAVTDGAETDRHVGIGSSPSEVLRAYPRAIYRPPGATDPFTEGFIWVNDISHPKLSFIVDPDSRQVSQIDLPRINFCE